MDELFGVPISSIAVVLGILFLIIVSMLAYIGVRNTILVRMAIRNVQRRPARGMLIIIGLMLATAIISSAFTTGDSITFSIKKGATDSLRSLDELIRVDDGSPVWENRPLPDEFDESIFQEVGPLLEADPNVDGVLPVLVETVAVVNTRTQQFEVESLFAGVDPSRANTFESLSDTEGNPADVASLGPDEVYIDLEGAEELEARPGDVLGVVLRSEELKQLRVRAVLDGWYAKGSNEETTSVSKVVLMVPLDRAQELLDKEGLLTYILVSNRGDAFEGESLTPNVLESFGSLSILTDNGLELFDIKRHLVEQANEVGSLFVSFFTTFGLFSIGVGLLLIFLIFSMLAAERKSEMGMSRAVGMQRSHLVRLFMAEGSIYSVGSAIVGATIGIGLGYLLVFITAGIFAEDPTEDFTLSAHVEPTSVLVSFFIGSVITFATVTFASWRISHLNIVRAIRDIPEPKLARASGRTLVWGILLTALGLFLLIAGFQQANLTLFGLSISLIAVGISFILRWRGLAQRWVLTVTGVVLLAYWLLPPSVYNRIRDDWNQDFSIFFVSGALVVTGAVLVTINNSRFVLRAATVTLGRIKRLAPIVKSAVSYPLRFGFRTGLSVAMFALVIFSITVMSTVIEGFNKLFDDQERLGGGYDVIAFAQGNLNSVMDLPSQVASNPDLAFVSRLNGEPAVGTFRSFAEADAHLAKEPDSEFNDTFVTGVDNDFIASNRYSITLATADFPTDPDLRSAAVWQALRDTDGLAIVNSLLVPARNNFGFEPTFDEFTLAGVEDLYLENEVMDPVEITVRDLKSNTVFDLTVIGVLDEFASSGPLPFGIYTSTSTLRAELPREVDSTQFFFQVEPGTEDAAERIEAAFFQNSLETIHLPEVIDDFQQGQRSFFNLLIGFMSLGLVVGTVALGVVSARAVVERRQQIGVLRSIGFSRSMVQLTFLAESSFIALLGIGLGLILGIVTSINVIDDIQTSEPDVQFIAPWLTMLIVSVGAYLFSLVTTYFPARQAGRVPPAEALHYE